MSDLINRVYASGGTEVIIDTLELSCAAWDSPQRIVRSFEDMTLGLEDGTTQAVFIAAPITIAYPKKSNSPTQTINFAIDNVTGEAQRLLDAAIEAQERISIVFRRYLSVDRTMPSEKPLYATVLSGSVKGTTVQVQAGFYDLLDYAYPRDTYTVEFAPGIQYL